MIEPAPGNPAADATRAAQEVPRLDDDPFHPTTLAVLAALFGLFPGVIFFALNWKRLGEPARARKELLIWLAVCAVLYPVLFLLPDSVPASVTFVPSLIAALQLRKAQATLFEGHRAAGGGKASGWWVGLAYLLWVVGLFGALFAWDTLEQQRFEQAREHLAAGRYAEAEPVFLEWIREYPDEPATFWNLSLVHENTGRLDEAIADMQRFVALAPEDPEGQARLSLLLSKAAQDEGAPLPDPAFEERLETLKSQLDELMRNAQRNAPEPRSGASLDEAPAGE